MTDSNNTNSRYNEAVNELAYLLADDMYDAFAPDIDIVEDEGPTIIAESGVVDDLFEAVVKRLNEMKAVSKIAEREQEQS